MARMWFMTFAGKPRDEEIHQIAHESPLVMTVPLIILACFSVIVAWGWPVYDAEKSYLEGQIHHSQHDAVIADFGLAEGDTWMGQVVEHIETARERALAQQFHSLAGDLALGLVAVGILFASMLYYSHVLDPREAVRQFPAVHRFLWNKWYFDELYSAVLVQPALVVAGWCQSFDLRVIDGTVNALARLVVWVSRWDGIFDLGVIDGLVNLTARVVYGIGAWFRTFQTGYLRSYVLFLVLAAVGIFVILSYFVAMATAG
jgi:NADH-quinone oxidoreductase subunit L